MKNATIAVGLCLAAASLSAQNLLLLPATASPAAELPDYALHPLMQTNSHVQMFYDQTEVGAAAFIATQLELRYDGPIPQVGYPGPFNIQRLRIRIGTTTVATPGARFADNLTSPLTTVQDGAWTFSPDPGSASPHPFGGPNGSLQFAFGQPVSIAIPPGGWLVVELLMEGNNIANFGYSHAILDGAATSGGPVNGTSVNFGQGCAAPNAAMPTISSTGVHAPGAAHFLQGQNLGANAPVFAIFGLSNTTATFGPLPYLMPLTNCSFLTSHDAYTLLVADAQGAITGTQAGAALAIPANSAFAGIVLFEQLAAYVTGANAYNVVLSDARMTTLGTMAPLGRGTLAVSHASSATDPIATDVKAFGYAMRLTTL